MPATVTRSGNRPSTAYSAILNSDSKEIVVGIDASRNRSGGAIAHLIGILKEATPAVHGIKQVHLWSFRSLLDLVPDYPWLVKHHPDQLDQSLSNQVWWQTTGLGSELKASGCDILFASDASTTSRFRPMVVLSQDMLSYEPGVMEQFGYGYQRARLWAILYLQNVAFKRAAGVIFLTRHAATVIQRSCGLLPNVVCIAHGVGREFHSIERVTGWPKAGEPIRCLYISATAPYKHQWNVVRAVAGLRNKGWNLQLSLVGGGEGKAQGRLEQEIARSDPSRGFVTQREFVSREELRKVLAEAHLFVFASSCESMPNTLLEAMAAGLPIACSDRGPMPEVLEDGGTYFDPEDVPSTAKAIERLITDEGSRNRMAAQAKALAGKYSWQKCSQETFAFISKTYKLHEERA